MQLFTHSLSLTYSLKKAALSLPLTTTAYPSLSHLISPLSSPLKKQKLISFFPSQNRFPCLSTNSQQTEGFLLPLSLTSSSTNSHTEERKPELLPLLFTNRNNILHSTANPLFLSSGRKPPTGLFSPFGFLHIKKRATEALSPPIFSAFPHSKPKHLSRDFIQPTHLPLLSHSNLHLPPLSLPSPLHSKPNQPLLSSRHRRTASTPSLSHTLSFSPSLHRAPPFSHSKLYSRILTHKTVQHFFPLFTLKASHFFSLTINPSSSYSKPPSPLTKPNSFSFSIPTTDDVKGKKSGIIF